MADYEVSKLMWMAIVIALAASIFVVAQPQIKTLANSTLDQVHHVIDGTTISGDSERPNPDDSKWVVKSDYGINGEFIMDADGNGFVIAKDTAKPIELNGIKPEQTIGNDQLKTLEYLDNVIATGDMSVVLGNNMNLTSIKGLDKWDTSGVTNMSYMFTNDSILTTITGLDNWDVSQVTNMSQMFSSEKALTSIGDLSKWDVSNVTILGGMFKETNSLTTVGDLNNWNVSKVTDMIGMYTNSKISDIPSWFTEALNP